MPSDTPALRDARDRNLLDRILDSPHLAHIVPRLPPEVLHRVIQTCGLEDCAELVALATPGQLTRVFDLDLWRSSQPGRDEQFDAERFGVWLEVLLESGASVAAQKLAAIDVDLVVAGLAQHARVFDSATVAPDVTADGEEIEPFRGSNDGLASDIGGYRLESRRTDAWDPIVAVLTALDARHRDCFHRLMGGVRLLSSSKPEVDGLDELLEAGDQAMFDLAVGRERRRERQGYVTPAQARAFLKASRQFHLEDDAVTKGNPVARAYFRAIDEDAETAETAAVDVTAAPRRLRPGSDAPPTAEQTAEAVAAVVDILLEAGVLAQPPRALLAGSPGEAPRLGRIQSLARFVFDRDPAAYSTRTEELAYLANTIMTGCSIQARPVTAQEASDAAVAVCNLGLENWPARGTATALQEPPELPDDFLVGHSLIPVFQIGWTVLHDEVSMYAAEQLIAILAGLRCIDREIQKGVNTLRMQMKKYWRAGEPWRARDALDVIESLDMPAWAALLGLIDECPVIHAGLGASTNSRTLAVSPSAFEFISENSQIAAVRDFMHALPEILGP